jgi:hypothetical protein
VSAIRDAALAYAARGWHVFPCEARGKRPLVAHGLNDASTDADQVTAWWRRWPAANVAIVTGTVSGIFVVDVDVKDEKHGDRTLVDLVVKHGPIGDTLHAITGGGGEHRFFAHPGWRVPNSTEKLGRGIDVRGDGGYVVAPPSVHENGHRYSWCTVRTLLPAPPWLLGLLRPKEDAPALPRGGSTYRPRVELAVRAAKYLERMEPSISGSGGHMALWAAAVALVCGFDLEPRDALDLLIHVFNPRCQPPWELNDLEHKVADADRKSRLGRGYLRDRERAA